MKAIDQALVLALASSLEPDSSSRLVVNELVQATMLSPREDVAVKRTMPKCKSLCERVAATSLWQPTHHLIEVKATH